MLVVLFVIYDQAGGSHSLSFINCTRWQLVGMLFQAYFNMAGSIDLFIRAPLIYRALVLKTPGRFTLDNYKEACRVALEINIMWSSLRFQIEP